MAFFDEQSAVIYFFLLYSYDTTTARSDGHGIGMYEFSVGPFTVPLVHESCLTPYSVDGHGNRCRLCRKHVQRFEHQVLDVVGIRKCSLRSSHYSGLHCSLLWAPTKPTTVLRLGKQLLLVAIRLLLVWQRHYHRPVSSSSLPLYLHQRELLPYRH